MASNLDKQNNIIDPIIEMLHKRISTLAKQIDNNKKDKVFNSIIKQQMILGNGKKYLKCVIE